jgi:hypothetical protein
VEVPTPGLLDLASLLTALRLTPTGEKLLPGQVALRPPQQRRLILMTTVGKATSIEETHVSQNQASHRRART